MYPNQPMTTATGQHKSLGRDSRPCKLFILCLKAIKYRLPAWIPDSIQWENAALRIQRCWRRSRQISARDKTIVNKALWTAVYMDRVRAADVFVRHGADVNDEVAFLDVFCHEMTPEFYFELDYLNPLGVAAAFGHVSMVAFLLDKHANIEGTGPCDRPIQLAARNNHVHVVSLLLQRGAQAEYSDYTDGPLYIAASHGNIDMMRLLLDHGVDVNQRCDIDETPLFQAVQNGGTGADAIQAVRFLLDRGADIEAENAMGARPLDAALLNGDASMIRLLIDCGASVDGLEEDLDALGISYERQDASHDGQTS